MTPEWAEAELVPVSALQHYVYCPRQCALIHVEQAFDENIHTLRGRHVHERVDEGGLEETEGARVERSLPIWSERHGLIGKADLVEFADDGTPYPVEYKHGRIKKKSFAADAAQLCAQALCLEEMTGHAVPRGAVYYFSSRRRREVDFTPELRAETERVIRETRALLTSSAIPLPFNDKRCRECSLHTICMPEMIGALAVNPFRPLPEP